jgi:photosystem II stability/assembly factor-like uncharacterized protein/Mrp family chromosome partitioning ATPase
MDSKPKRKPPKGRVITFYSYKGGTGRSMAVANVAWLLAMNGERVLVVDWDLEAPGIHRYFHPLLDDKELLETEGMLDFVEKLAMRAAAASEPLGEKEVDILEYVKVLQWPGNFPVSWEKFGPNAGIDLLIAGRQGPLYGKRLNAFSFVDFYEKLGGRRFLKMAREQMRSIYDYVLIDSRTGVSDTSGICTVEMPDTLVVCFTLNDQSIIGASGVAHDVMEQRKKLDAGELVSFTLRSGAPSPETKFKIFPVPTRVEINGQTPRRQIALALARKKFSPFLEEHLDRSEWSRYWGGVQMAYFTDYAFEEIPAVFNDPPHQLISLLASMKEIARAVSGDNALDVRGLADDEERSESLRKDILGWYLRKAEADLADPLALVQTTYDQSRDQLAMRRVLLRLVQPGGETPVATNAEMSDFSQEQLVMVRGLADAGILAISGNSVSIADRRVVERWDRLAQWVKEDEAFLKWRQPFSVAARAWQASAKEKSQLLRGKSYSQAIEWLVKRNDDLNGTEREFVLSSRSLYRRNVTIGLVAMAVLLVIGVFGTVRVYQDLRRYFAPAGEYWTVQTTVPGAELFSVFGSSDGKSVWAVGAHGTTSQIVNLYGSSNHFTTPVLHSGFATSTGSHAWAVGQNGTILESNDGRTWSAVGETDASQYLTSVFGTSDGKTLWAVGLAGAILKSSDGEHWRAAASGTTASLYSIFCTGDGKRVWAVGDGGIILDSSDGGTWIKRVSGTSSHLHSVFGTSDGKQLWAAGQNGTILESRDGVHWAPVIRGESSAFYGGFVTADGKRVWVVGENGTILESNDGSHWIRRKSVDSADLRSVFGTSDGKRLWAVGEGGIILESHGR